MDKILWLLCFGEWDRSGFLLFCHRQFYFLDYWFRLLNPFSNQNNTLLLLQAVLAICIDIHAVRNIDKIVWVQKKTLSSTA